MCALHGSLSPSNLHLSSRNSVWNAVYIILSVGEKKAYSKMLQQEFHEQKHDRSRYAGNGGDVGDQFLGTQLVRGGYRLEGRTHSGYVSLDASTSVLPIECESMPRQFIEDPTRGGGAFGPGHVVIVVTVTLVRHLNTSFRWRQISVSTVIDRPVHYVIQHEAQSKTGCEYIALGSGGHILIEGGQGYETHNDGDCNRSYHRHKVAPIEYIGIIPYSPEEIVEGSCDGAAEKTNDRDRFRR